MIFEPLCQAHLIRLHLCFLAIFAWMAQLQAAAANPANPPAKVDRTVSEVDFNTVTLTPKAVERLRIKTIPVERRDIPHVRTFGGEVIIAMNEISSGDQGNSQSILSVLPSMTPTDRIRIAEAQVDADAAVIAARVQLEATQISMKRAERMFKERSGSQRAVDDARTQLQLAESELAKATARRELLGPPVLYQSTPDKIWIRVPVYVGDLPHLDKSKPARVRSLASENGDPGVPAFSVNAPPSANASASSVDLFFELENGDQQFQLGERVGVSLALKTAENSLVVPWASIITDIFGGTWVYENTADHLFVRKRVQVRRVAGDLAVLATGPEVGSKIVTDGAAELFGTEVGFSK